MKNQELFDRTIGILVNAYLKGTLQHGDPCACAVGNMIGAGLKLEVMSDLSWSDGTYWATTQWDNVHNFESVEPDMTRYYGEAKIQLDATGYSPCDTLKIEKAFELKRHDIFLSLMSVCDTLMQIHEASTEEISEAKRLFVKKTA